MAPPILTFALDGVGEGEWLASRPGRWREQPYQWNRMLDGPYSWSRSCREEINLLPPPRIEHRPSSPSLYRLSYPGPHHLLQHRNILYFLHSVLMCFRVNTDIIKPLVFVRRHIVFSVRQELNFLMLS
jgi:hypothetical protein